jgi:glycosyltransferase involved in cell wall biosynthesis
MKPRVVVLTTYYRPMLGGVESSAERFARFLHDEGFGVRVITKRIGPALPDREIIDGIEVRRIGIPGDRAASGKWLLTAPLFCWLVRHASVYDVVCVIDYRGIGAAALAARAFTGRPAAFQGQTPWVLADDAAAGQPRLVPRLLKTPLRALYRRADAIVCISRSLEDEAFSCGVPRERVHFMPNAVDMARFHPPAAGERERLRQERGWALNRPVCCFVGRLSLEKGLLDLLEAWKLLQPIAAHLVIAGPDMPGNPWNVGPAAREFVAREGLQDSVEFLGPMADVAPLLRAVDVVVQPSHFEAQGLSAVEALACGVPVVASSVGGLLDFVVDGQNGRLCPPRNPTALASAIRSVVSDDAFRRRLADAARASVVDEYDEQRVFSRFGGLLQQLSEERR